MKDYYSILGVSKTATPDEIKKAYRKLAAIHHPDKGGDVARFQEIQEANEILSDTKKRQEYDNPASNFGGFDFGGFDFSGFGGFGGFGNSGGFGGFKTNVHVDIEPIYVNIKLNFNDFKNGKSETITFERDKECTNCNVSHSHTSCMRCSGSGMEFKVVDTIMGRVQAQVPCSDCNGTGIQNGKPTGNCNDCNNTGYVKESHTMSVDVPPGVCSEINISISNAGNFNNISRTNGDVVLKIEEDFGDNIQRIGETLIYPIYNYTIINNNYVFKFEFDGSEMKLPTSSNQRGFLRPASGPRLYNNKVMDVYYQLILK